MLAVELFSSRVLACWMRSEYPTASLYIYAQMCVDTKVTM